MSKKRERRRCAPILLKSVETEDLLLVIRRKCLDCCCGSKKMVKACKTYDCALFPYRQCYALVQIDMDALLDDERSE